ncbi:MAG: hypothetical protein WDA11_08590 [Thiohalomonadaceae bacterium]
MAISWLAVLQAVPWGQVIENAPKVADGARKLWNSVSGTPGPETHVPPGSEDATGNGAQAFSALEKRIEALEAGTKELHEQMLASSELIKHLAEQNAQLVARVEAHRRRIVWISATASIATLFAVTALVITATT